MHHEKVLRKFLPKLKKHLDKNGIDTGIYTLKWFFQCFLDRVSIKQSDDGGPSEKSVCVKAPYRFSTVSTERKHCFDSSRSHSA